MMGIIVVAAFAFFVCGVCAFAFTVARRLMADCDRDE
jgi:hypothetical protein